MNPFFFGTKARRLFGVYTPAASQASRRALVLCHPWGQEYIRAHRSMRQLAIRLARADVHVLRFDYFGTGDSAGDMLDADLEGWERDIESALAELRDTTGADAVGLVGLRLGATLAARVAARQGDEVQQLVLWDPVVRGTAYLESLRGGAPAPDGERPEELFGFELSRRLADEIEALDLREVAARLRPRSLVVLSTEETPEEIAPSGALEVERVLAPSPWIEEKIDRTGTGVGTIPVKVLDRIVEWLA
jgi:pimeloyl-ACP methyl ester carboxylesterase